MSLIEDFKVECVFMEKTKVSDGEGGFVNSWSEGENLNAAIVFDNSLQSRIADKQGVTNLYTITTDRNVLLEFHDVIKRVSDGKVFRITSDGSDSKTPTVATLSFCQVSAEEWVLP